MSCSWSAPDADGIITLYLDVGAAITLRGRRKRRGVSENPHAVALWPATWRELLRGWIKQGGPKRKWVTLLGAAGEERMHDAPKVLDELLKAGLIEVEERRNGGPWESRCVEFLDLETLRESVGLANREKQRQRSEEHCATPLQCGLLEPLRASLDGMPPERAIRRHTILMALDRWIVEERIGTRRDFALFARGNTKGVSTAEWDWINSTIKLEESGISRHTPAVWLRAPLVLVSGAGKLDLRGVPDCIGLSPETVKRIVMVEGRVEHWIVLENRTVFERVARSMGNSRGVIWVPGFAPSWWKDAVAAIMRVCPANARISCDPDPAGIDIALDVGRIWSERDLVWEPWHMDCTTLSSLPNKKGLSDDDRCRLSRLLSSPLPDVLRKLACLMLETGEKGEQEGVNYNDETL
jgi:hypothetical protein